MIPLAGPRPGARRRAGLGALVGGACLGALSAQAADSTGQFAIKGGGAQTCDVFAAAHTAQSRDLLIYGGWVEGYATGLNQFQADSFDVLPWQTTELLLGLLASYCRTQPQERLIDALNRLVREVFPQRLTAPSPIVSVQDGARTTLHYAAVLDRVAGALRDQGFDPGTAPAGQAFPPGLAAALRAFQTTKGLSPTGLPDQQTLFELLLRPLNPD